MSFSHTVTIKASGQGIETTTTPKVMKKSLNLHNVLQTVQVRVLDYLTKGHDKVITNFETVGVNVMAEEGDVVVAVREEVVEKPVKDNVPVV